MERRCLLYGGAAIPLDPPDHAQAMIGRIHPCAACL
jgi:hypothetical protein